MTSFPTVLNDSNRTTLRASGYWSRVMTCLCPEEIVFQAQASQSITDAPFITFTWDSTSVGSYTSVWAGMIVYISSTTDLRDAKYRGRVRLAPSSTEFYIDLNATILNNNDYVTVVRDTDIFARIRQGDLADGSITPHDLPPQTIGLPYVTVLYDSNADGTVTWTPTQTGLAVDAAASSISTWAWAVSGAGSSSINNAALQNPTFTLAAGYHYLIRVIYTDNNGVSNYQIVHVYTVTRTFSAPVVQAVVTGSISADLDSGWTANLTAYADVSTTLDRTHCVVWHVQHFGDDSTTPFVTNVLMEGRIRSSSIQTEGSIEAGQVQEVTFAVEGLTAYLRRLKIPNDIIRATAAPDAWGEITDPTPYRMAVYAMSLYTTLTNLGSFGVETGAFGAWTIGGEPRAIDGGFAWDVLANILDPIKAAVNTSGSGEVFLAQTTSYKADRSGVSLITTFSLDDLISYTIDLDSSRTTAQVIAFAGVFNSTSNTFDLYTAQAPSIVYGDGGEIREITREILMVDSTIEEAQEEVGLRASNDYAFNNPKPLLSATLFDSYSGVIQPTNYQRWAVNVPASSNVLGKAWSASDYWFIQSITLSVSADGTIGTSFDAPAETSFDDAQIVASLLPINLEGMNPVLPILPNEPAFPTDPLELYPTDTPTLEELQPIDSNTGFQTFTPIPPDVAAEMAESSPPVGCKNLNVNFIFTSNTTSTWTTVLNDPYLMKISGSTVVTFDDTNCQNLTVSANSWYASDNVGTPQATFGQYIAGQGLAPNDDPLPDPDNKSFFFTRPAQVGGATVDSVTFTFNEAVTNFSFRRLGSAAIVYSGAAATSITFSESTDPAFFPLNLSAQAIAITFTTSNKAPTTTFRVIQWCYTPV